MVAAVFLCGVLCIAVSRFFSWAIRPNARQVDEGGVLEYSKPFKTAVILGTSGITSFALFVVMDLTGQISFLAAGAGVFLVFYMLREFTFTIRYNRVGFEVIDPWFSRQFVQWNAIVSVVPVYSAGDHLLTVDHREVRIPFGLSGVQSLLDELNARGLRPQPPVSGIKAYRLRRQQRRLAHEAGAVPEQSCNKG